MDSRRRSKDMDSPKQIVKTSKNLESTGQIVKTSKATDLTGQIVTTSNEASDESRQVVAWDSSDSSPQTVATSTTT